MNLVCRDTNLKKNILLRLKGFFKSIVAYDIPEEVNEVVFCSDDEDKLKKDVLSKFMGDVDDIADVMKCLKVY